MGNIFLCSDFHFGHNKHFLYKPRGFSSIQTHDEALMENFNSVVTHDDEVYILGDLMLNDNKHGIECLQRLHGNLHIMLGNHDTASRIALYTSLPAVREVEYATFLKACGYHFYLSHYPSLVANHDDDKPLKAKMISLCGHAHTDDPFLDWDKGIIFHCEVDAHSNFPIALDDIVEQIRNRINTENPKAYTVKDTSDLIINRHRFILGECHKCVHSNYCGPRPYESKCPPGMNYKRDPPDGGYYG